MLKYTAIDCYNERSRQREREISFSSLSREDEEKLYQINQYSDVRYHFTVGKFQVEVENELLATGIEQLSECDREIILLYYFLGFKNRDIAEFYNLTERTVARYKSRAIKQMRKAMQEELEG